MPAKSSRSASPMLAGRYPPWPSSSVSFPALPCARSCHTSPATAPRSRSTPSATRRKVRWPSSAPPSRPRSSSSVRPPRRRCVTASGSRASTRVARAHAGGGGLHPPQVLPPVLAQGLPAPGPQPVPEGLDLAERLLEVVGGDRGELLQLPVAPFQLPGERLHLFLDPLALGQVPGDLR